MNDCLQRHLFFIITWNYENLQNIFTLIIKWYKYLNVWTNIKIYDFMVYGYWLRIMQCECLCF